MRAVPGTAFCPHPCSRSARTRLATVASLFLPLHCLSWHRQRSFPDPGTVSQLGSSLSSSSCSFTRRPPRSIFQRCKYGHDRLLPALLGPAVARRAPWGSVLAGRDPAHMTRPRPLPLCVRRRLGLHLHDLFFTCSLLVPPPHLCNCWFLCQKCSPALSSEAPSSYFSFRFQPEQCPSGDVFSVAHVYLWAALSYVEPPTPCYYGTGLQRLLCGSDIQNTVKISSVYSFLVLAALTLSLCTGRL